MEAMYSVYPIIGVVVGGVKHNFAFHEVEIGFPYTKYTNLSLPPPPPDFYLLFLEVFCYVFAPS